MIKRLIIWTLVIVIVLSTFAYLGINLFVTEKDYRRPGRFGSYPESGMYTYDSTTILKSLNKSQGNVFTPFFGNPDEIELDYDPVTWSQSDYLKIVDAVSWKTWGESLGSEDWKIESVYFAQNCQDRPRGFNIFHIVYYKELGVTNWKRSYTTRLIDLEPWRGLAYWGGNAIFSSNLLSRWKPIDLEDFAISADRALQMANELGGNETDKSHCSTISVSMFQHDNETWDVNYFAANFGLYIDAYSGKYKILSSDQ